MFTTLWNFVSLLCISHLGLVYHMMSFLYKNAISNESYHIRRYLLSFFQTEKRASCSDIITNNRQSQRNFKHTISAVNVHNSEATLAHVLLIYRTYIWAYSSNEKIAATFIHIFHCATFDIFDRSPIYHLSIWEQKVLRENLRSKCHLKASRLGNISTQTIDRNTQIWTFIFFYYLTNKQMIADTSLI